MSCTVKLQFDAATFKKSTNAQFIVNFSGLNSCCICLRKFRQEEEEDELSANEKNSNDEQSGDEENSEQDELINFDDDILPKEEPGDAPFLLENACSSANHSCPTFECYSAGDESHLVWSNNHCAHDKCKMIKICEELRFHSMNPKCFDRVCYDCFHGLVEKSLEKPKLFLDDGHNLSIKCPICNDGTISKMFLSSSLQTKVNEAISKERKRRCEICSYCPVTGCDYKESGIVSGTNCPTHLYHCATCWEQLTNPEKHVCNNIPKELEEFEESTRFCRCANCKMMFLRGEGCCNMTCSRCQMRFEFTQLQKKVDWEKEGDVELVMSQTNSTRSQAQAALAKRNGDIVEAIMLLTI